MWLFKKKKAIKASGRAVLIAELIIEKVLVVQRKWAHWMNNHVNRYPMYIKKILFFSMLAFGGLYFSYNIFSVFIRPDQQATTPVRATIPLTRLPYHTPLPAKDSLAIEGILKFNRYLEILDQSTVGKRRKDSLLRSRPGLADSLKLISEWYKQNHGKINNH